MLVAEVNQWHLTLTICGRLCHEAIPRRTVRDCKVIFTGVVRRNNFPTCRCLMVFQSRPSLTTWRWLMCDRAGQFYDQPVLDIFSITTQLTTWQCLMFATFKTFTDCPAIKHIKHSGTEHFFDLLVGWPRSVVAWTDQYSFTTCWSILYWLSQGVTYVSFVYVASLLME